MAYLCTAAEVLAFAPEFCGVPIPVIEKFIMLADGQIGELWGSRAKHAEILLTAHMLSVSKVKDGGAGAGGGAVGGVSGVTVGQVSVQYAGVSGAGGSVDASLAASSYGVEFNRLAMLAAAGVAVV